jgi:6-pyruvoyltetrahydropterin/6-carboxytetrahydropterin synthase
MDFGIVKLLLCSWLEDEWDHRMLLWESDADLTELQRLDKTVVALPFNPTAENLAAHLLNVVGPKVLDGSGVKLVAVNVEETRKCSAAATL